MAASKFNRYWTLIITFLVAIIAVGGIVTWVRYSSSEPVEISIPPPQELQGDIYIGGAVNNPGFYPLKAGDTIEGIIQIAGGASSSADLSQLKLYISWIEEEEEPQKINLNRAEVWLLKALPGIGETRAQAIVDYRLWSGRFHNINELTRVEGIGAATFDQIKHLITVAD